MDTPGKCKKRRKLELGHTELELGCEMLDNHTGRRHKTTLDPKTVLYWEA